MRAKWQAEMELRTAIGTTGSRCPFVLALISGQRFRAKAYDFRWDGIASLRARKQDALTLYG